MNGMECSKSSLPISPQTFSKRLPLKKIALLGAAHIHTPGFVKKLVARPDYHIAGVWDHDADRALHNSEQLGCHVISGVQELLKIEGLEAVIVCAETDRHEELIEQVAKARKHCFAEKPLGIGKSDSERMQKVLEDAGVLFQTGYFNRSKAAYRKIKELIDAGSFGAISRIRLNNCHSGLQRNIFEGWEWLTDMKQSGVGAFGDLGTHVLDLLLWFMGDLDSVTATLNQPMGRYPGCDENGEAILRFKSGVIASIAAGWLDLAQPMTAQVSGTKAHAYVAQDELYLVGDEIPNADGQSPYTDLPENLPHAFDLFLDAVQSGNGANLVSPKEAAYRSTVMEAIYQAAETRQWVSVEPYS